MTIFVYGGSCCGKSEFAEGLITSDPNPARVYIATMEIFGEEAVRRVERHRKMRAAKGFATVEAPRELEAAAREVPVGASALLECLGNLSANELFAPEGERGIDKAFEKIAAGLAALERRCSRLVVVSNDVFTGGGEYGAEVLRYCELLDRVNRLAAQRADAVYEVACGFPILIKGGGLG